MGLNLGVFRFLPTTHTKTGAKPTRPQFLCAMQHFTHVLSSHPDHSRCSDIRTRWTPIILITRKTQKTPKSSPISGWSWLRFWDLWCISMILTHIVREATDLLVGYALSASSASCLACAIASSSVLLLSLAFSRKVLRSSTDISLTTLIPIGLELAIICLQISLRSTSCRFVSCFLTLAIS